MGPFQALVFNVTEGIPRVGELLERMWRKPTGKATKYGQGLVYEVARPSTMPDECLINAFWGWPRPRCSLCIATPGEGRGRAGTAPC